MNPSRALSRSLSHLRLLHPSNETLEFQHYLRKVRGVSETCNRFNPKPDNENEQIADLLLGLTKAKKTWGFGLCFLYLRNVQG